MSERDARHPNGLRPPRHVGYPKQSRSFFPDKSNPSRGTAKSGSLLDKNQRAMDAVLRKTPASPILWFRKELRHVWHRSCQAYAGHTGERV